ncbi:hypothetical protein T440DRAFT_194417 [Plenodomus tracheiphilus IPT5]|uniref:Uncharacterized protein n=1 Tax=Plenodomus tracheiphilus IPT5 TaxID=1408161 RepID=A0A6A7AWR0_9PLEO|nr:hypothetical protein T440DRAFT_194417 [Plenodomus tracheiphilus IPT5]
MRPANACIHAWLAREPRLLSCICRVSMAHSAGNGLFPSQDEHRNSPSGRRRTRPLSLLSECYWSTWAYVEAQSWLLKPVFLRFMLCCGDQSKGNPFSSCTKSTHGCMQYTRWLLC